MSKLLFETVYKKSEPGDEYLSGFQLAKSFPNHTLVYLTEFEDDLLFLLYPGDVEPAMDVVLAALNKEEGFEEHYAQYQQEIEDELNESAFNMIES